MFRGWDSDEEELLRGSVELLQAHEPPEGYLGCFSGGKDSIVIKHIADNIAGVKTRWSYIVTTIDPPEVIRFLKQHHQDVVWNHSKHGNFFVRMEEKACIPTRRVRWCCDEYKEQRGPLGSTMLMGIRAEESAAREENWNQVDLHRRTKRKTVLPILHWDSEFLWNFIAAEGLPYPSLYDEGFHRLGCIGCPLADRSARRREFDRWPGFERRWRLSFKRIWEKRAGMPQNDGKEWFGSACFRDWEEMWRWWNSNLSFPTPEEMQPLEVERWLTCFVCERRISKSRFKRFGRICTMCAGRIRHTGPVDMGHGCCVRIVQPTP